MLKINYEMLDLGLVYYPGIVQETEKIINVIEDIDKDLADTGMRSIFKEWSPWTYNDTIFNWQKFFPRPEAIPADDPYAIEMKDITKTLYTALDLAFNHYVTELYPFAKENIKAEEYEMHLLKYEKSGHLPAHQDQGISSRVLSTVIYLNDDYSGGEIEFKHSNVKIKPKAGSIIFFPSNFLYVHEVYPISDGVRYSLPHWYHNMKNIVNSSGEV
jgi:Rps23 Pro-64 3,4-dihydroxylase Tpa1-like proline 4-hydroxylase